MSHPGSVHIPFTSRRGFLRSAGLATGAVALPTLLAACATSANQPAAGESKAAGGPVDPANPFGVTAGETEAVVFAGGNGVEYLDTALKLFSDKHAGAQIKVTTTQDIGSLQPRFVNQNPPDTFQNSGAKALDATALTGNGQLAELEDLMSAPSWDDPDATVEETLGAGARLAGTIDGKLVGFNFVQYAWGFWHDAALFTERGWEVPTTWEDLMTLCAKIKSEGIAPLAFTGMHPYYVTNGMLQPLVAKIGGQDVWKSVDNLEEGAWHQDAIIQAVDALRQFRTDDFILPGVAQMTHIQSQTAWLGHQAAFIPVGAWLENEMRSAIPEGFALTATALPGPGGERSDLTPNNAGAAWYVPAQAKNMAGAKELLRSLVSKEVARKFAEMTNNVTVVKGAHDDQDLGPAFASISTMIKKSDAVEPWQPVKFGSWYKSLDTEAAAALMAVMLGDLDAKGFADRCQKKADEVKADSKIKKLTR
ncbi:N-acetylglucosamine/diacetylchitobiose ABC transporter substrate-binding protein [Microlunatus sp. Y2014]|uniref:N-acetylglucosamine/diacetylchitobiose ABC transporter substrate-binding protein n=1 Tax=Microlunatus sp. Y2014 TaxID=3418488 RepID=UPI003DA744E1